MRGQEINKDGGRLVVELSRVYVACDDCGHSRNLYLMNLRKASELGVHTYRDLCRKIRCGECPPMPVHARNLTIIPTWREDGLSTHSHETQSCERRKRDQRQTQVHSSRLRRGCTDTDEESEPNGIQSV